MLDGGDELENCLGLVRERAVDLGGGERIEGKEEGLRFHTDEVIIDQVRHAVSCGGQMTQQRSAHNLREVGRERPIKLGDILFSPK